MAVFRGRGATANAGPTAAADRPTFSRSLLLRGIAGLACAATVWLLFVRHVKPLDLEVFLRAGHAVSDGASPYASVTSSAVFSGHAFVYPYLTAWPFAPLSGLHIATAALVYYLLSLCALAVSLRLLGGVRPTLPLVLLAFASEPVVRALQLGTVNVWLLLGLAIAWRYRERSPAVVTALVALVVVKLFLAPMLIWLLITGRRRPMWWTAALSVVCVVGGCMFAHLSVPSFVRMLGVLSAHEAPHSSSLASRLIDLGIGHVMASVVAAVCAAGVIATTWWRYRSSGDERWVFCGCVLASLVLSPIVWSHYWTLLLVAPVLWRWGARAALGTLLASWLVSAPVGEPALQSLRGLDGVAPALEAVAGMVLLAAGWPTLRRTVLTRARPTGTTGGSIS